MQIKDKDRALRMVSKDGMKIKYLSNELKNDFDVVSAAIKQDPNAYNYSGKKAQSDPRVYNAYLEAKILQKIKPQASGEAQPGEN